MFDRLRDFTDRLLGRGSAAITVPVMDGALLPNRVLDDATVLAELPGIDDLALRGGQLLASADNALWHRQDGGAWVPWMSLDADITALAVSPQGRVAVALAGREVRVLTEDGRTESSLTQLAGQPLVAANALAWQDEQTLLFSDGSRHHAPARWSHDLMTLGRSGRAGRWAVAQTQSALVADALGYAYGVLPRPGAPGGVLVSESWQHRVVQAATGQAAARQQAGVAPQPLLSELPCYPSRMAPCSSGGFWLTCFASRTQLVEFVLREPAYRSRMVAEIAPQHWIAPALSSGHSFMEPLQGAGVKNMGVLKPWAPPRSYGLVLQVAADGRVLRSLHSRVDGKHHGITAAVEHGGCLYVASKGSGRLLRIDLEAQPGDAA